MKIILIMLMLLFSSVALAQTIENRDPSGRITGRCFAQGNQWVCKSPNGRITSTTRIIPRNQNSNPHYFQDNNLNDVPDYYPEKRNGLLPFQDEYNSLSKMLKFDSSGMLIGYVIMHRSGNWHLFDSNGKLIATNTNP
jgi:hypothetical protein